MINKAIIMGRITANPELRKTPSGVSTCTFSVAVERNYKNGAERLTDFLTVVAWRQTAEFVSSYFKKGELIAVDGTLQARKYTDKNGNNRTAVEIVADNISFCGSGKKNGEAGGTITETTSSEFAPIDTDGAEDLPFN